MRAPIVSANHRNGDAVLNTPNRSDADVLRIYGNLSLLEMAPVLLAADRIYPGATLVRHGSVMALWDKASEIVSLASEGRADIATNSEMQILHSSAGNPDLRIIFTVAECPYRIVARRSAGITALADLRGKRVGTQPGSSGDYFLQAMLRTAGLTPGDVTYVPFMARTDAPVSLLPEKLRDGDIDAVALWEPQVERAKRAVRDDAVEFCDPAVYTEKFNLCTTQGNLDDPAMRPRIVAFVRALIAASECLKAEPEAGWPLVAEAVGLEVETVRHAWPRFTYPGTLAPDLLDILEREEPWVAELQNRVPRDRETLAGFIDDSVLRDARAG